MSTILINSGPIKLTLILWKLNLNSMEDNTALLIPIVKNLAKIYIEATIFHLVTPLIILIPVVCLLLHVCLNSYNTLNQRCARGYSQNTP